MCYNYNMKFPDKCTATGKPECYTNGKETERFVLEGETTLEVAALRAALANVALAVLQSEQTLDPDEARTLIDFMQISSYEQKRVTVTRRQAERLARLVSRGGASCDTSMLKNQFDTRISKEYESLKDDEVAEKAMTLAAEIADEVTAREFRHELKSLPDEFLDDAAEG